jgi:hypothetical protein
MRPFLEFFDELQLEQVDLPTQSSLDLWEVLEDDA